MLISLAARAAISESSSCSDNSCNDSCNKRTVDIGRLCTALGMEPTGSITHADHGAFIRSLVEWAQSAGVLVLGIDDLANYLVIKYNCRRLVQVHEQQLPFMPHVARLVSQAASERYAVVDTSVVDRLAAALSSPFEPSVVLRGPRGSGKHSAVLALANRIMDHNVPKALLGAEIMMVDLAIDDAREVVDQLLDYAATKSKCIVYLMNVSAIVNMQAADDLLSIVHSKCKKIVTMTDEVYKYFASADTCRRFSVIDNVPADDATTACVLRMKASMLERIHGVNVPSTAIDDVVVSSGTYSGANPGKAVSLLDTACALASKRAYTKLQSVVDDSSPQVLIGSIASMNTISAGHVELCSADIDNAVVMLTRADNVSAAHVASGQMIHQLTHVIKQHVVGQDHVIEQLCADICTHAVFNDGMRPASFMMVGSSSVGKTYTAEVLAEALGYQILVLDMANYTERHTISRLIGSPPGYVGYQEGGTLTNFIKEHNKCVIVFDELEKAHPEVHNVLLGMLDRGRLSDMAGNSVSCSGCVFIMTGNIGTEILLSKAEYGLGFGSKRIDKVSMVIAEIKKTINPALVDRIGRFLVFNKLTKDHLYTIIDLELAKLITEQSPFVELDDLAKDALLADWESGHGARSVKRKLLEPLALVAADDRPDKASMKYVVSHDGDAYFIKDITADGKRHARRPLYHSGGKQMVIRPAAEATGGFGNGE